MVSGESWTMPHGVAAPGNVLPRPCPPSALRGCCVTAPMNGFTSSAMSSHGRSPPKEYGREPFHHVSIDLGENAFVRSSTSRQVSPSAEHQIAHDFGLRSG